MRASSHARSSSASSRLRRASRHTGTVSPIDDRIRSATSASRISASSASSGRGERRVEGVDEAAERRVAHDRLVHRRPDEVLAQHARLEVDGALAVARARRRAAVMDHVRREDGHHRRRRRARRPVEVVADGPLVDHEQRPDVVRVRRVGVLGERRVQHLADPGDGGVHARIDSVAARSSMGAGSYKTAAVATTYGRVVTAVLALDRLLVRELRDPGPEQRDALGIGRDVRLPTDRAPHRRHGGRDRCHDAGRGRRAWRR